MVKDLLLLLLSLWNIDADVDYDYDDDHGMLDYSHFVLPSLLICSRCTSKPITGIIIYCACTTV